MQCEDARRAAVLARYGEPLPDPVARHVAQCEACEALQARESRLDELLALDSTEPPRPGFDTRFSARLEEEKARQGRRSRARFLWALLPLAAGAAIALIRVPPAPPRDVPNEDLALAMELELVEELPLMRRLDEVEAYDVLSELSDQELDAILQEVDP